MDIERYIKEAHQNAIDFGFFEYGGEDAAKRSALEYVFQEMDK